MNWKSNCFYTYERERASTQIVFYLERDNILELLLMLLLLIFINRILFMFISIVHTLYMHRARSRVNKDITRKCVCLLL